MEPEFIRSFHKNKLFICKNKYAINIVLLFTILVTCALIHLQISSNKTIVPKEPASITHINRAMFFWKYSYSDLAWWSESYTGRFPEDLADEYSWQDTEFVTELGKIVLTSTAKLVDNEVLVAIIDSGFCIDMVPDEYLWKNFMEIAGDGIDNDNNGYVDDINGTSVRENYPVITNNVAFASHGTLLLGLFAGSRKGYRGLLTNSGVKFILVRVLDDQGLCSVEQLMAGISYAEQCGADICSLSLTTAVNDERLRSLIEQSNMLFVVPAGNEGGQLGEVISYPAMYGLDNVITVAAMRADGCLSGVSNFGENYVDIAAPGADIVTIDGKGRMQLCSGTSFAVPFVVAAATSIKAYSSDITAEEIKKQIVQAAIPNERLFGIVRSAGYVCFKVLETNK